MDDLLALGLGATRDSLKVEGRYGTVTGTEVTMNPVALAGVITRHGLRCPNFSVESETRTCLNGDDYILTWWTLTWLRPTEEIPSEYLQPEDFRPGDEVRWTRHGVELTAWVDELTPKRVRVTTEDAQSHLVRTSSLKIMPRRGLRVA